MRSFTVIGFLITGAVVFLSILNESYVSLFGWFCCIIYLFVINAKDKEIDGLHIIIDAQCDLLKSYEKKLVSLNTDNPESSDF